MVFILLLKSTALVSRSCQVTVKESLFRRFAWGCSSTLRKSVSPFLDFLSYRLIIWLTDRNYRHQIKKICNFQKIETNFQVTVIPFWPHFRHSMSPQDVGICRGKRRTVSIALTLAWSRSSDIRLRAKHRPPRSTI